MCSEARALRTTRFRATSHKPITKSRRKRKGASPSVLACEWMTGAVATDEPDGLCRAATRAARTARSHPAAQQRQKTPSPTAHISPIRARPVSLGFSPAHRGSSYWLVRMEQGQEASGALVPVLRAPFPQARNWIGYCLTATSTVTTVMACCIACETKMRSNGSRCNGGKAARCANASSSIGTLPIRCSAR